MEAATEPADGERPQPWEVVDEAERGDFEIFRVRRLRARSPRDGAEHDFHVAVSPDSVLVVTLAEDGRMVMVEQFRHGSREVTLEPPAGIMEPGESPEEAAARELREETGFVGERPEVIGCLQINPSWQRARVYVAVVRGARRRTEKDEDAGEETRVRLMEVDEVWRRVRAGEVRTAVAVAALALWRNGGGRDGA